MEFDRRANETIGRGQRRSTDLSLLASKRFCRAQSISDGVNPKRILSISPVLDDGVGLRRVGERIKHDPEWVASI
jgi:hypothetical protein